MVVVAATVIAVTITPAVVTVVVAIAPAVAPVLPVTIPISVAVTPILAAIPAAIVPNKPARVLVQVPLNRRVRIQETIEIAQLGAGNIVIGHLPPSQRRKSSAQDNGQKHEAKILSEHSSSLEPCGFRRHDSVFIRGNPPHATKFRAAAERLRRIFSDREATFFTHVRRINVLLHL
jgi:hypothetical protein